MSRDKNLYEKSQNRQDQRERPKEKDLKAQMATNEGSE